MKIKVENTKVRIRENHYEKLRKLSEETGYPIVYLVQMALDRYLAGFGRKGVKKG
jgi:predicted DNA-binding protein